MQDTVFAILTDQGGPPPHGSLLDYAELAAAIAVVSALFVAARQIRVFIDHAKTERAFNFMARWNDTDFTHARRPVITFARQHPGDGRAQREQVENDENFRSQLHLFLNFFEEIGLAVRRNRVDSDLCRDFFSSVIIKYYEEFQPFIIYTKERTGKPKLWVHFKYLYDEMQKEQVDK